MRFEIPKTADGQFKFPNGTVKHYKNGKKNGLVTLPDGTQKWYHNNTLHRNDGPAVIYPNGRTEWYLHGVQQVTVWYKEMYQIDGHNLIHRDILDGPAITMHTWTLMYNDEINEYEIEDGDHDWYDESFIVNGKKIKNDMVDNARDFEIKQLTQRLERATGRSVLLYSK
jgi:hypothetical protein